MSQPENNPYVILLPDVRLSFPHLFIAHSMEEGQEPKFSASFILDAVKHKALIDSIEQKIDRIALDFWKKKIGFKRCLRDGNERAELDGYGDGTFFMNSTSKRRPIVVNRAREPLTEADGAIYAGCYVNARIGLWVQDNKFGKRVNAELRGVQFLRDGESFGAPKINAEEEFEKIDEDGKGGVDDF